MEPKVADPVRITDAVRVLDAQFPRLRAQLEARARRRVGREDAEDLAAACYVEARKSLETYQPQRSLAAWLFGILDNLVRLHLRRARIRREQGGSGLAVPEQVDEQTAQSAGDSAQWAALQQRLAVTPLTDRQRACIAGTLDGLTQQQIAVHLRIGQRMVSYHIEAAVARLRVSALRDGADMDDWRGLELFCRCAQHAVYRKPHSFDNQSPSLLRERRRWAVLRDEPRTARAQPATTHPATPQPPRRRRMPV